MTRARVISQGLWPTAAGDATVIGAVSAGTTQTTGYQIPVGVEYVEFATVGSGDACTLNDVGAAASDSVEIVNLGANALAVFPPVGGYIGTGAVNVVSGTTIAAGGYAIFVRTSVAGKWVQK